MSDGRGGGGGVGWGAPSTTQGSGGFRAGVGFLHLNRWPMRAHSFLAGRGPLFTGARLGDPQAARGRVQGAFRSPSPVPASLAPTPTPTPRRIPVPLPAFTRSLSLPSSLRECSLAPKGECRAGFWFRWAHSCRGKSRNWAWVSLASLPMGDLNTGFQFLCPYLPGPNVSAQSYRRPPPVDG